MTLPLWFDALFLDADQRDLAPDRRPRLVRAEGAQPHEDQALLGELASPDLNTAAGALEGIFRCWYPKLLAFARMVTGDESSAQDVVQDIFIDVWRRRATLVLSGSLAAYLHSAVRHRAFTRHRDESNRQRLLGTIDAAEYAGTIASEPAPTSELDAREREDDRKFRAVIAAADALPPRAREVFYLRWRQSLSNKEIAAIMGISVKTVEAQMTIAMRRVRGELRAL